MKRELRTAAAILSIGFSVMAVEVRVPLLVGDSIPVMQRPGTPITADTVGWNSIEKSFGFAHQFSATSPEAACARFKAAGKSVLLVESPTALDLALIHDAGCEIISLSRLYFYRFSQLESGDFGTAAEIDKAAGVSRSYWEMITGYSLYDTIGADIRMRIMAAGGSYVDYKGADNLIKTFSVLHNNGLPQWSTTELYIKKQTEKVYAISPLSKVQLTRAIEGVMNKLKLDLSIGPPQFRAVVCTPGADSLAVAPRKAPEPAIVEEEIYPSDADSLSDTAGAKDSSGVAAGMPSRQITVPNSSVSAAASAKTAEADTVRVRRAVPHDETPVLLNVIMGCAFTSFIVVMGLVLNTAGMH